MKSLGSCLLLLGLAGGVFALLSHRELRAAATSEAPPSPDSLPLTEIICPELFDQQNTTTPPAELASIAFRRISIVGLSGFFAIIMGVLLLVKKPTQRAT